MSELPNRAALRAAIKEFLKDADIESMTTKHARQAMKRKFDLEDEVINTAEAKELIRELLMDELKNHETPQKGKPQSPEKKKTESSDDDFEGEKGSKAVKRKLSDDEPLKKKAKKQNSKDTQSSSEEKDGEPTEPSGKEEEGGEEKGEGENECERSSGGEEEEQGGRKRKKEAAKKKRQKAPTAKSETKYEKGSDRVEKLKRYIRECGVIKPYSRILAGKTDKQQVNTLMEILKELGVEGQPTLKKCKEIKERREELKELADLQTDNILSGPRRTRSSDPKEENPTRKVVRKARISDSESGSGSEEEEEHSPEPDLSFLAAGESSDGEEAASKKKPPSPVVPPADAKLAAEIFSD
eukprot:comp14070_c1_seq1/m.9933 comp14070_c1_seq1/g.9933  ORF comp14070_c1_seq1/g.9933 comp14070_c1_seq1/m.9933 type:complete len:355 (-) comp14070_c1_seq1:294-1358(-)